MFCGMATGVARTGKEEALARAALEHAEALRQQPGCVGAYVLRERGTGAQISLAIFNSEEAFEQGMQTTMPIIAKHHLEDLRDGLSTFRVFDVR
jgi:heme-degrading monooxygenase HmoA